MGKVGWALYLVVFIMIVLVQFLYLFGLLFFSLLTCSEQSNTASAVPLRSSDVPQAATQFGCVWTLFFSLACRDC
jgi:hypothetical protein